MKAEGEGFRNPPRTSRPPPHCLPPGGPLNRSPGTHRFSRKHRLANDSGIGLIEQIRGSELMIAARDDDSHEKSETDSLPSLPPRAQQMGGVRIEQERPSSQHTRYESPANLDVPRCRWRCSKPCTCACTHCHPRLLDAKQPSPADAGPRDTKEINNSNLRTLYRK